MKILCSLRTFQHTYNIYCIYVITLYNIYIHTLIIYIFLDLNIIISELNYTYLYIHLKKKYMDTIKILLYINIKMYRYVYMAPLYSIYFLRFLFGWSITQQRTKFVSFCDGRKTVHFLHLASSCDRIENGLG